MQGPDPALVSLPWVPPAERPAVLQHGQHQPRAISQAGAKGEGTVVLPISQNHGGTQSISPPRGCPGELCSSAGAPHFSTHMGMPGRSPHPTQGGGMSHAPPNRHSPPPNTVSVPYKPLGPFNQELKLWLNSSYPSPPGPTAGKIFCPGFLQPESDHLPLSRAEPSTQQSRTEKQPSSGCPWRSGYMSADQLLRTAVSLLRQRSKTQHRQN